VSLAAMRMPAAPPRPRTRDFLRKLGEGFRYGLGSRPIRHMLIFIASCSLASSCMAVLMPAFASDLLGGDERVFGWLSAASGLGALCGAYYLALRSSVRGLGRVMTSAAGGLALVMLAFAWSRWLWLSLLLSAGAGLSLMLIVAAGNTVLQTIVDDERRGRVMGLFATAFFGMFPLGSLTGGWVANAIGEPWTVTLAGTGCLGAVVWFATRLPGLRKQVGPIFEARGLEPMAAPTVEPPADPAASRP
jgi:MFS family permease